eukprot:m.481328 g.481328  ORF g.481328 m.481328 type:complete len:96 (-) comp22133_c0_seq1:295-582(-)
MDEKKALNGEHKTRREAFVSSNGKLKRLAPYSFTAFVAFMAMNAVLACFCVNAIGSLFCVNCFFSLGSMNSVLSIFSLNSFCAIGCSGKAFAVCI